MLNIGGGELLLILLVALIFLGPDRLPQMARQFGQTVTSLRTMARGFQAELEAAARPDPLVASPDESLPAAATATDPDEISRAARAVQHDDYADDNPDEGGPTDLYAEEE